MPLRSMVNSSSATNPIDVVEAAYDLEADDGAWLRRVVELVRPLVDRGRGVLGYTFELPLASAMWLPQHVFLGMSAAEAGAYEAMATAGLRNGITRPMHVDPEALGSMQETASRNHLGPKLVASTLLAPLARLRIRDVIALRTVEPGGKGIVIAGPSAEDLHVDRRAKRLWSRVAAHLAAGRRLRAAMSEDGIEAILTPSGKLDDARGDAASRSARAALRDAVARIEGARGRARRTEPERATEAWTALVAGRWSLVDRFERGGRRFVVARKNPHGLADPRGLGERERAIAHLAALGKSNKLIAYELGLAESTIATHLASAMRKLRARSRVDLVRLLAALGRP
ncbi:MAG: helix-turn-helix transcriptional regulator [Acidobacteriota bacterium]